ncbi:MAG TPA: cytochrome o ubiquinol oxidase subunit III [Rhabdochlamydiaceae bacterium]|nr:cytochrome o ubiquinol oxidase subunit III [Rhabdochlamydiaceae bacterium]
MNEAIEFREETKVSTLMADTKVFGFWVYLMTDLVIFAALFAAYLVLRNNTFGGPSGRDLFNLPFALTETLILLSSSFTCSLAMLAVHLEKKKAAIFWFLVTFFLGVSFLYLEFSEFSEFTQMGAGPERSGFLSAFFTLVGTHGLHISVGLLWMGAAMVRIWRRPLAAHNISRIFRMALFWHFLDFVWIFIFTIVYGMAFVLR